MRYDGMEINMVGTSVERTLVAIGFWTIGFALLGVAGVLFALSGQKDGQDEDVSVDEVDETGDALDEGWINEMLEDLDEPEEPSRVDETDDLDEFWKSVMEVDDLDEPEDWYEAPEQEEHHDDQQEDSQAEQREDEQVGQQEGPREEPRDDGQEEGQDGGQEESHDGQQEVEQDAGETESETEQIAYSTPSGKTWHADRDCPRLRRSKNIRELRVSEAVEAGMKPCGVCGK